MNKRKARDLLKPFCASESGRYALDKVGCRDGWLCATNACVAVRLPTSGVPDTPDPFPEIGTLPWSSRAIGPWPAMESAGEGSPGWRFVRVGKKKIDEKYWRLIAALPGVRLARSEKGANKPIAFTFDGGGQGLVMPIVSQKAASEEPKS